MIELFYLLNCHHWKMDDSIATMNGRLRWMSFRTEMLKDCGIENEDLRCQTSDARLVTLVLMIPKNMLSVDCIYARTYAKLHFAYFAKPSFADAKA